MEGEDRGKDRWMDRARKEQTPRAGQWRWERKTVRMAGGPVGVWVGGHQQVAGRGNRMHDKSSWEQVRVNGS